MPECNFYLRYGYCANLDECLYLHIDPAKKLPPCPWYEQGFCPNGPNCARRHVRRAIICPFYLAGFCPDGRLKCQRGAHPKWKVLEGRPPVKGEETETAAAGTTADGAAADTKGEQGSHEAGHPLEGEDGGPPIRRPPDAGHGTGWGRDRDRDRDDAEGHRRGDRDRDHRGGRGGPGKWRGGKKKAMWRQNHG